MLLCRVRLGPVSLQKAKPQLSAVIEALLLSFTLQQRSVFLAVLNTVMVVYEEKKPQLENSYTRTPPILV